MSMSSEQAPAAPTRVLSREDSERLIAGVLAAMGELEAVLEQESALVRVGRIKEGLAQEERKNELASAYIRGLEAVKANAIALARFAPDRLEGLRREHARFGRVIETNQAVLATARAVSESLVKGVVEEMNRLARPQGYAPAGQHAARTPAGAPLVVSKSL
jgi:hypothetical protein